MGTRLISMAINYHLQDQFLSAFFATRFGNDFYLTGGTALARFYFHHRESVDLDLFTNNQQIDFSEINLAIIKISQQLNLTLLQQATDKTFLQYILTTQDKSTLKIDVVKDIPVHFGQIITKNNVRLDSLENIGSNKVLAIFGRTDPKDFIDLYYIIQKTKFDLEYFFQLAKQKDLGLNEFYLANSLDQLKNAPVYPVLLKSIDKNKLLKFYHNLSRQLLLKIKPRE